LKLRFMLVAVCAGGCLFAQLPGTGGEYGGPSILSRGGVGEPSSQSAIGIRFSAGVSFIYDSGILPVSVDKNGNLINVNGIYGEQFRATVSGTKAWKHKALSLSFTGDYQHYSQNTYFDGFNTALSLGYEDQISRRISVESQVTAGTSTFAFSNLNGLYLPSLTAVGVPTADIFDNRVYYLQTSDQLVYQQSARLSYSFGGDGFGVRHQSSALVGVNGYGAVGTAAYRLTRRTTIDVSYNYMHFDYTKAFGEADIHQLEVGLSRALTRRWQFNVQGGAFYINTIGIAEVTVDPAIAALFGQSTTFAAFTRQKVYEAGAVAVSGKYGRSTVTLSYSRAPSPGNGVYLASVSDQAGAGYNYQTTRNLSLFLSANYSRLESVGQSNLASYAYYGGGGGMSYRVTHSLFASASVEARSAQINVTNGLSQVGYQVTIGLSFSPGTLPLALW
jgi:hypothetical protein